MASRHHTHRKGSHNSSSRSHGDSWVEAVADLQEGNDDGIIGPKGAAQQPHLQPGGHPLGAAADLAPSVQAESKQQQRTESAPASGTSSTAVSTPGGGGGAAGQPVAASTTLQPVAHAGSSSSSSGGGSGGGGGSGSGQDFQARLDQVLQYMIKELGDVGEVVLQLGGAATCMGPGAGGAMDPQRVAACVARVLVVAGQHGADVAVVREHQQHQQAPAPAAAVAPQQAPPPAAAAAASQQQPAASAAPAAAPSAAQPRAEPDGKSGSGVCALVIRRRAAGGAHPPLEVRVAVIGNVDSGKSTLVGVLTRSMLDDGRGSARAKVFKHAHEESTGRTSSIGQHTLCLDARGNVLNDGLFRSQTCGDYVSRSSKVITLVDLAGHEKYFRTTAYGLTGHLPDYACLLVGANMGVVGMCREHLGVALALKVPVFFVITKVDIAPEHILRQTVQGLTTILKKPGVRRKPFLVRSAEDVLTCARCINTDSLAPIFLTSAVSGRGLDLLRLFVSLLPQRQRWGERRAEHAEFLIDETFAVPGVGTVVAGTVKRGVIAPGVSLMMGPDIADGSFKPVTVKSIHYKRLPVQQTAALALKKVKRSQVRKGMVLVDERSKPAASWEFDADIAILTHSTTIQPRYQAVIHCEIIRQAAVVVAMDRERLRSGDRACVRFRFLQHPEYLTPNSRFVFREGRTKGIGCVMATEHDAGGGASQQQQQQAPAQGQGQHGQAPAAPAAAAEGTGPAAPPSPPATAAAGAPRVAPAGGPQAAQAAPAAAEPAPSSAPAASIEPAAARGVSGSGRRAESAEGKHKAAGERRGGGGRAAAAAEPPAGSVD